MWSPDFPNWQYRPVEPSFPIVTQLVFGATIPWLIVSPYELIFDISETNNIYYRIIKVSLQFGKNIHDRVHHYAATLEIEPINFIDVLWLGDYCTYLFSIYDFMFRSNILCFHINKNSYDAPLSPEDELQGVSPHVFCLHGIGKLIHDQSIYNNSTNFFTNKQYI